MAPFLNILVKAGMSHTSDARRAKRRLGERNEISSLFYKVAHMDSYDEHAVVDFEGLAVNLSAITANPAIRASLLWESHEVNFRAELLALDTLLVPQKNWMEIHRWEREMVVSGVWGPPSSAATVAAPTDRASRVFCWYSPPHEHWERGREQLRYFAQVLMRWPGCPEVVIQGSKRDKLLEGQYQDVQRQAGPLSTAHDRSQLTIARQYALHQDSYWFTAEWNYLDEAVKDADVQEFLAKHDHDKARGLLVALFRNKFTEPVDGETDAEFKKRLRGTSKARQSVVSRRTTETREQWEARMVTLPNAIQEWLKNWRTRNKRQGGKKWSPPSMPAPLKCKPHVTAPFEAFCKSDEAPKGGDYVTEDGRRRCDIQALQAARLVAWNKLLEEEQQCYREAAKDALSEIGYGRPGEDDEGADEGNAHAVAHAEDIAAHVDQFVKVLHDSTVGWTQLEFETVFALWVEQCRKGPEVPEANTFALTARRAVEYARANRETLLAPGRPATTRGAPPSAAGVLMCSRAIGGWLEDPARVTRFPIMNYDTMDAAGQVDHAIVNGLAALKMGRSQPANPDGEPSLTSTTPDGMLTTVTNPVSADTATEDGATTHSSSDGTPPPGDDLPPAANDAEEIVFPQDGSNYAPNCPFDCCQLDLGQAPSGDGAEEPASPRALDCFAHEPTGSLSSSVEMTIHGEPRAVDIGTIARGPAESAPAPQDALSQDDVAASADEGGNTNRKRLRKVSQLSGVPMPGIRGMAVIEREARARTSRKSRRELTQDGTLPLTAIACT
ncbi:hypothetical protein LXA43DRAFT_1091018 [Ganoderma leucocontextum]|nr:hypothetical protein LXA43DRAFT_1091018 [Ganoderma leucocontextum]